MTSAPSSMTATARPWPVKPSVQRRPHPPWARFRAAWVADGVFPHLHAGAVRLGAAQGGGVHAHGEYGEVVVAAGDDSRSGGGLQCAGELVAGDRHAAGAALADLVAGEIVGAGRGTEQSRGKNERVENRRSEYACGALALVGLHLWVRRLLVHDASYGRIRVNIDRPAAKKSDQGLPPLEPIGGRRPPTPEVRRLGFMG